MVIETIDLNGPHSFYALSSQLKLNDILPSKITIWKLRNNNPLRKSYISNNIKIEEFDALIKITAEMSRYLYPYIRDILQSRDDFDNNGDTWIDFKKRFIELVNERFNIYSIKVKKIIDPGLNDKFLIKLLFTLSLCSCQNGFEKLKSILIDY
mgnify:CR=1 FL=1